MSKRVPEHVNPPQEDPVALAPYNFVPLPQTIVLAEDEYVPHNAYDSKRTTGTITCTLTADSPLYIRCALISAEFKRSEDERGHPVHNFLQFAKNTPDFFYTENSQVPVIPGSSLRGMLRSLVEIVSYGKMEKIADKGLMYRAVGDTTSHGNTYRSRLMHTSRPNHYEGKMQAGYMEQVGGDWYIRPAIDQSGMTFRRIEFQYPNRIPAGLRPWKTSHNAQEIYIQTDPYRPHDHNNHRVTLYYSAVTYASAAPQSGFDAGVLVKTGHINRKHMHFVFHLPDTTKLINELPHLSDAAISRYREQLTKEQLSLLGGAGVLRDGQPVFYIVEKGEVLFGHAMMFRLPYQQSPRDLVPFYDDFAAKTDIAEGIFGYVPSHFLDTRKPYAGRINISSAICVTMPQEPEPTTSLIIPRVLGTPKPTTFQHYLVQQTPERIFRRDRNGNVLYDESGNPRHHKNLSDYDSSATETAIRGHKQYWHKEEVTRQDIEDNDFVARLHDPTLRNPRDPDPLTDTQHTQFKPVSVGATFKFDIHFENLSQVELGALLWVLRLCDDSYTADKGGPYRFKLGMGKPLGMGSVKLTTTAIKHIEHQSRYTALFDDTGWITGENELSDTTRDECLHQFEEYVLKQSGEHARGYDDLAGTLRMRCLLALLRWAGPLPTQTRYLEIERNAVDVWIPGSRSNRDGTKANEYVARPVLPTPLGVIGEAPPRPTHQPERETHTSDRSAVVRTETRTRGAEEQVVAPSRAPASQPAPTPAPAAAPQLPAVGDIITGQRARQLVTLRFKGERKKVVAITPNRTISYTLPRNTVLEIYADDQMMGGGFYGQVIDIDDSEPRKLVLLVKREKRPQNQ
jgi:CRISPR-associated protein (TIGR03986 family)